MNIKIVKAINGGTISAIASKSQAHRMLICAALSQDETFILCTERSEDIDATVRCLQGMGAVIRYEKDGFIVTPIKLNVKKQSKPLELNCGESGSTLRFLLPVCAALGLSVFFHMSGKLPSRPICALHDEMLSHGCKLSRPNGGSPLLCEGCLKSGEYTIAGNVSSQYISGLLFALPLLSGDSTIRVAGNFESRPYVDMTLDALELFGITVCEDEEGVFKIKGGQFFNSPKTVHVEGDWSNAAFWLTAGAMGKNSVKCTGLNLKSRQGDMAITEILERFGAQVTYGVDSVTVSPATLRGIDIDAQHTPDLVPVLAAAASIAQGTTVIRNAQRLRIKESDRLHTVAACLQSLGADITESSDGLVITGKNTLTGGETQSFGDHRIAMTAAILSLACRAEVTINEADAVNKSYPHFFKDFTEKLGGKTH